MPSTLPSPHIGSVTSVVEVSGVVSVSVSPTESESMLAVVPVAEVSSPVADMPLSVGSSVSLVVWLVWVVGPLVVGVVSSVVAPVVESSAPPVVVSGSLPHAVMATAPSPRVKSREMLRAMVMVIPYLRRRAHMLRDGPGPQANTMRPRFQAGCCR